MQCNECGIDNGDFERAYEKIERLELENEALKSLRDELFERIENLQASYEECFHSSNLLRTEHARLLKDNILLKSHYSDALEILDQLDKYFTSGNAIPVERATILAKDYWAIRNGEGVSNGIHN